MAFHSYCRPTFARIKSSTYKNYKQKFSFDIGPIYKVLEGYGKFFHHYTMESIHGQIKYECRNKSDQMRYMLIVVPEM